MILQLSKHGLGTLQTCKHDLQLSKHNLQFSKHGRVSQTWSTFYVHTAYVYSV